MEAGADVQAVGHIIIVVGCRANQLQASDGQSYRLN